jgi:hypothetical protein
MVATPSADVQMRNHYGIRRLSQVAGAGSVRHKLRYQFLMTPCGCKVRGARTAWSACTSARFHHATFVCHGTILYFTITTSIALQQTSYQVRARTCTLNMFRARSAPRFACFVIKHVLWRSNEHLHIYILICVSEAQLQEA